MVTTQACHLWFLSEKDLCKRLYKQLRSPFQK